MLQVRERTVLPPDCVLYSTVSFQNLLDVYSSGIRGDTQREEKNWKYCSNNIDRV